MGEGVGVSEIDVVWGVQDFSYYAEKVPACLLWLGIRNESVGAVHDLHHPKVCLPVRDVTMRQI